MAEDPLALFAVASAGTVEQWDGHPTPPGILLRWFLPTGIDPPDFGFDVHRARVPDVPPLPFNDLNVPFVEGKPSWTYGSVTLSCPNGLHFEPAQLIGWWQLMVTASNPLTLDFATPAWLVQVVAGDRTVGLDAIGSSGGTVRVSDRLTVFGAYLTWRTRGLQRVVITGEGSISFAGFHLLEDKASWQLLSHLCLPVIDPGYPCGPLSGVDEADTARRRLPAGPATEWSTRFAAQFDDMLPVLRRLALHGPSEQLPSSTDPEAPAIGADDRALLEFGLLDPHVARMAGFAFDDPLGGVLDGVEYIYKVTGAWRGTPAAYLAADGDVLQRLAADGAATVVPSQTPPGVEVTFTPPVLELDATWSQGAGVVWVVTDLGGGVTSGVLGSDGQLTAGRVGSLSLAFAGAAPVLEALSFTPRVTRVGLIPGIVAVEPGPPPGPTSISAVVTRLSPSLPALAALDWVTDRAPDGTVQEGSPVGYQVGHRQLATDPRAPEPTPPAWTDRSDLVADGGLIYLPEPTAQRESIGPPGLYLDGLHTRLSEGWWGWWCRGVDLFGRVSGPTPWAVAAVADDGPPPAPVLIAAEYLQPAVPVIATGRGPEAVRWLADHPDADGLLVSWRYGPDQADQNGDVTRFRLALRHPAPGQTGPGAYPAFPSGPPGATSGTTGIVAELGPVTIPMTASVTAATTDPVIAVTITAVTALPPNPLTPAAGRASSLCRVDLAGDGTGTIFAGGTLTVAGSALSVVACGDGPELVLTVEHPTGTVVVEGPAELRAPTGRIVAVEAALTPPTVAGLRAGGGLLTWQSVGGDGRLVVVVASGSRLLCASGDAGPAVGSTVAWYPDWFAQLDGNLVGLTPAADRPATAQVAVRAVREGGPESSPSGPGTVTAVDATVPEPPALSAIAFDPADRCVVLASPATPFHGRSSFTVRWTADASRTVRVWRALADEVCRLDLAEHDREGRAHSFPDPAWPTGVRSDPVRRQRVLAELAAVDAARAAVGPGRPDAVQAAYDALTIDTQMLLARQTYASAAFTALTAEPLAGDHYEDEFDGRSHGHRFYRLSSRTASGMESGPSEPTPPICAPDVVAPAVPLALLVLADEAGGAVAVRWQASPDADLALYELVAARQPVAEADLERLTPALTVTPSPHKPGATVEATLRLDPGDWCIWVRAVDMSGNCSAFSRMLRGRSLVPRPAPPVWIRAERMGGVVRLEWNHPADGRLATLVERRMPGTDLWRPLTAAFLPRGRYTLNDDPPDPATGWEYRLRVADHQGQSAVELPVITLGGP